jgi:hypothetical protein
MKIHDALCFPYLPHFYIIEGQCRLISSINQLFHNIQNVKQMPPTVVQTRFNIAFVYDEELILFKQTYLRR